MGTLASPRNLYYYFKKGNIISDFSKRILSGNFYYSNTNYYRAVLSQYVNFASYVHIFNGTGQLNTIHTDKNIQPDILGADARCVILKHGKPDFIFTDKSLSVYVYKWKFNGLKTRCEVHLYKNKAFLVNYIYNQLEKDEREYILNTVANKYLDKYLTKVNLDKSKISDKNNNVLFVSDFLTGLKISYLSNCESDWYEEMASFVNTRQTKHAERIKHGERRFFNKI
jgi:hypothetical protein